MSVDQMSVDELSWKLHKRLHQNVHVSIHPGLCGSANSSTKLTVNSFITSPSFEEDSCTFKMLQEPNIIHSGADPASGCASMGYINKSTLIKIKV